MQKLINIIGVVVLVGILTKLSYVFVYLFAELDNGGFVAKATGITFAFASIYFVVKVKQRWLKGTVVLLDISTILYYYLHEDLHISIAYASIIVAAYSGIIVYFLGRIVSEQATIANDTVAIRQRIADDTATQRQRYEYERQRIESELPKVRRRIRDSRTDATRQGHEARLEQLLAEDEQLREKLNQ